MQVKEVDASAVQEVAGSLPELPTVACQTGASRGGGIWLSLCGQWFYIYI